MQIFLKKGFSFSKEIPTEQWEMKPNCVRKNYEIEFYCNLNRSARRAVWRQRVRLEGKIYVHNEGQL